jgi:hypothetical protein
MKSFFRFTFLMFLFTAIASAAYAVDTAADYVRRGWIVRDDLETACSLMDECVSLYGADADKQAAGLTAFPVKGREAEYALMTDVATCLFIKGEAYMRAGRNEDAVKTFEIIVEKYPWAQQWDPRGWYWSVKEKAVQSLVKLDPSWCDTHADACEQNAGQPEFPVSSIILADEGKEFPVEYIKYGKFEGVGTSDYKYVVSDQQGLTEAVGEGIYPNSTSVRYDPEFVKVKKQVLQIDHWQVLGSRDLKSAFYRWCFAPEPTHVRLFYLGDILERSGLIAHAVKAYYAGVVHYPMGYGKTYWDTPWYTAKSSIDRIRYLLDTHPELGYTLEGAHVKVINGFDNDVSNDRFIVEPGKFVKRSEVQSAAARELGEEVRSVGEHVRLVQYTSGDWKLFVDAKPFLIKGVTYDPSRVGEAPDDGSLKEWTTQDTNGNGIIDSPYETWVDKNGNNVQDSDEPVVGDFALMKEMGVNCIRRYHQPHEPDKKVLRELYDNYGIMTMMGDFLGKYAIGSGADWEIGTDYRNEEQQKAMLESVLKMVNDHKDEPYILMWVLGNENVYGVACNADKDPEAFFTFVNQVAKKIKEVDPSRPVAIASGDLLYVDLFGRLCPDVDIFGTNAYRGKYGFGAMFRDVKDFTGKPVMLTEYGVSSLANGFTHEEGEAYQAEYYEGTWKDMLANRAGYGEGNALGGVAFEWLDEWWKAYEPAVHDERGQFIGPFLDGYIHEEWLGICGQGDGSKSPFLRQLKKSYYTYKKWWNETPGE